MARSWQQTNSESSRPFVPVICDPVAIFRCQISSVYLTPGGMWDVGGWLVAQTLEGPFSAVPEPVFPRGFAYLSFLTTEPRALYAVMLAVGAFYQQKQISSEIYETLQDRNDDDINTVCWCS